MSVATETQYEQLVRQGREAREQADSVQWIEGDLALEVEALAPTDRPRDPETGEFLADADTALKRFADDIDVNQRTLRDYRVTAKAWPSGARAPRTSWRTHRELATQADRFDLIREGMTSREARKIVRDLASKSNSGDTLSWFVLLGRVSDALTDAAKHMSKVEDAITRQPNEEFCARADEYAAAAEGIAARLREFGAS